MNNVDALNVVLNNEINQDLQRLRVENKELKERMERIEHHSAKMARRMFNIVSLARAQNEDEYDLKYEKAIESLDGCKCCIDEFEQDTEDLAGDLGDWHHGFNSGALAFSRFVLSFTQKEQYYNEYNELVGLTLEELEEQALEDFPFLDT